MKKGMVIEYEKKDIDFNNVNYDGGFCMYGLWNVR